jgi:hypothetical protein
MWTKQMTTGCPVKQWYTNLQDVVHWEELRKDGQNSCEEEEQEEVEEKIYLCLYTR